MSPEDAEAYFEQYEQKQVMDAVKRIYLRDTD